MDRSYESYNRFGSETSTALARLINYMFYDNKIRLKLVLSRKQKIPDSNSKTDNLTDFRVKYGIYP